MKHRNIIAVLFLRAPLGLALALLAPLALVAALLAIPADEARADSGHPGLFPLHCAAGIDGNLAVVVHLLGSAHGVLSFPIPVNTRDFSGSYSCGGGSQFGRRHTPLHYAVYYGRATIAATLIGAGANVNATSNAGDTPLHRAAGRGHASIVSLLLAAGANVNAENNNSETPLRRARTNSLRALLIAAGGHWGEACAGAAVVNPAGPTPPCLCESPNLGTPDACAAPSETVCAGLTPPKFYDAAAGVCKASIEICAGLIPPEFYDANTGECEAYPSWGNYPLHYAAGQGGDLAAVVQLLRLGSARGIDVNAKDGAGDTPLHHAASHGRATIAATLIAAGANVNATNTYGETPLHGAAFRGASIVSLLLAAGANVNARNTSGETPLHLAAYGGYASVVSVLLAAGANVNAKDSDGETPLHRARFNPSLVSVLIAAGGHWGEACARAAVVNPAGPTPPCLCESSNVGTPAACAAPSVESCGGLTPPRFYSPMLSACAPHDECIAAGDCTHAPLAHDPDGWTAAITMNDPGLVSHFIADHGKDPDAKVRFSNGRRNGGGETPIHHAVVKDYHLAAVALLEGGADINRRRGGGSNYYEDHLDAPLHTALRHGSGRMITILLNAGADVNLRGHNNDAPLHRAIRYRRAFVKLLIDRGANLDGWGAGYKSDRPLHQVARFSDSPDNVALVSLLLDKGADPNTRNDDRLRPLDLAFGKDDSLPPRQGMMAALIAWGANWSHECPAGAIPNKNYRGLAQVATYPECRCPPHLSERDGGGECVCPAHSHSQVNELCLPKDSAQVELEIEKMRAELERLRAELAALNLRLSLAADGPPEMLEEIAKQAEVAARGIARRRNNFLALARAGLAEADDAGAAPTLALSDTEATCRMLEGEVQTHSRTGSKICSGIDHNDTFCIVGSASAFPCVGLFRHVRRCNDDHNRPALDPWHCAAPCPSGLRARGAKCAAD